MSDHGQHVSDWAAVRFGRKFADNKFRDGSWVEQLTSQTNLSLFDVDVTRQQGQYPLREQPFGVAAIANVIVACLILAAAIFLSMR